MSILNDTKKVLGLMPDYDVFNPDILMHINTTFFTLGQLGLGPEGGIYIDDATEWSEVIGDDPNLNAVKTYVYLRVRMLFDPPATSYLINAMTEQVRELEWRLNVYREGLVEEVIIDAGGI